MVGHHLTVALWRSRKDFIVNGPVIMTANKACTDHLSGVVCDWSVREIITTMLVVTCQILLETLVRNYRHLYLWFFFKWKKIYNCLTCESFKEQYNYVEHNYEPIKVCCNYDYLRTKIPEKVLKMCFHLSYSGFYAALKKDSKFETIIMFVFHLV